MNTFEIGPKEISEGNYVLAIADGQGCTLYLEAADVPEVQRQLTHTALDIQRKESSNEKTVIVPPEISLRWTREGAGSHSYVAVAPGGYILRVMLTEGVWVALLGDQRIDSFDKKRLAQVACEQAVTSGGASVVFLEEK